MRIEFGLKMLDVLIEYQGKINIEFDAQLYLSSFFSKEEINYLLCLKGIRDNAKEVQLAEKAE